MSGSRGNRVGTPDVLRVTWFLEVRQISQGERPGCCRLGAEESREGGKSYSESQASFDPRCGAEPTASGLEPRHRFNLEETADSPRFLGNPLCTRPALRSRWALATSQYAALVLSSPVFMGADPCKRGSISGLHHTAHALAVYASPWWSPGHDARLASGGG